MVGRLKKLKPQEIVLYVLTITAIAYLLSSPYYLFAILPGIGLFLILTLGRRPQWGYYVIVFFVPLTIFRTLSGSLTVSKILGFGIIVFVFLYLVLNKSGRFDVSSDLWKWFTLFFFISLFSTLFSGFKDTAFNGLRQLLIAYMFFLLTLIFISRDSFFSVIPKLVMVSVTFSSAMAVFGYLFNVGSLTIGTEVENGLKRAVGGEIDPNAFSFLVLFCLPFFAHLFFNPQRKLDRTIGAAGYLINIAALITSYSRGGALIFLISLAMTFFVYRDRISVRHLGIVFSVTALLAVLAILIIPSSYWNRQLSISDTQDQAVTRRSSYLTFAFEVLWDKPLMGYGTDTFKDLYMTSAYTRDMSRISDLRRGSHNSYIEVLIGNGILGLLVFLIMIGIAISSFTTARKRFLARGDTEAAAMVLTYFLSFLAILFYLFILEAQYHKYFWLALGLSQVALRFATDGTEARSSQSGLVRS